MHPWGVGVGGGWGGYPISATHNGPCSVLNWRYGGINATRVVTGKTNSYRHKTVLNLLYIYCGILCTVIILHTGLFCTSYVQVCSQKMFNVTNQRKCTEYLHIRV